MNPVDALDDLACHERAVTGSGGTRLDIGDLHRPAGGFDLDANAHGTEVLDLPARRVIGGRGGEEKRVVGREDVTRRRPVTGCGAGCCK